MPTVVGIDRPRHPDFDAYWYGDESRGIKAHAKMVYWAASRAARHARRPDMTDELLGTAVLAFNHVLHHYDPAKGAFTTLYGFCVGELIGRHFLRYESQWEHLHFFQKQRKKRGWKSGPLPPDKFVGKLPYEWEVGEADPAVLRYDEASPTRYKVWEAAAACLSEKELFVMESRYRDGKTLRETGLELGCSKERVRQIKNEAAAKLREALATDPDVRGDYGEGP